MQSIRITDRAHLDRLAENMAAVIRAIERGAYAVEVGVDPLDNGAKFKVDNGPWCPPICGQVRPSMSDHRASRIEQTRASMERTSRQLGDSRDV